MAKTTMKKTKKMTEKKTSFEPGKMTVVIATSSVLILFALALLVTRF